MQDMEKLGARQRATFMDWQKNYRLSAELIRKETPHVLLDRLGEYADIFEELPSGKKELEKRFERIESAKAYVIAFELQQEETATRSLLVRYEQLEGHLGQALVVVDRNIAENRDQTNLTVSTISMIAAVVAGVVSITGLIVAILALTRMH
jgi:hypothetical protein